MSKTVKIKDYFPVEKAHDLPYLNRKSRVYLQDLNFNIKLMMRCSCVHLDQQQARADTHVVL